MSKLVKRMSDDFVRTLPHELVTHVVAGCGERGEKWLRELPHIIRKLEQNWSVTVGEPFPGIEFNFVAAATDASGAEVVVKIAPPWEPVEIDDEARFLQHRAGRSCVRLIGNDATHRAILMERILPGRSLWETFAADKAGCVAPAIDLLKKTLSAPPADAAAITHLDDWYAKFERYSSTSFPQDYGRRALDIYLRLRRTAGRDLYLHGDFHPGNLITKADEGFVLIDPKGIIGHLGYDIGVFLNNLNWWQEREPDVRENLDAAVIQFSQAFEMDPLEIREWAYSQMVIGAWWNFIDMPDLYDGSVVKADVWNV